MAEPWQAQPCTLTLSAAEGSQAWPNEQMGKCSGLTVKHLGSVVAPADFALKKRSIMLSWKNEVRTCDEVNSPVLMVHIHY